jgi:hypothetical protein
MTAPTEWLDAWNAYNTFVKERTERTIPHCDSRILHAPWACEYCDRPEWTDKRLELKIAFTGDTPPTGFAPCQADYERGENHKLWRGNKPTSWTENPEQWPEESAASKALYGWVDTEDDPN